MSIRILLLILLATLGVNALSQNLSTIFNNVDTIFIQGGIPGHISPIDLNTTPIVSNSACSIPLYNFAVATFYQNGKVLAIGHEGLLANSNINQYDNSAFLINAMNWLDPGTHKIALKEGWINNTNSSVLQATLISNGFTFNILSGNITNTSLSDTDILVLGNDWNGTQPYLTSELAALDTFVTNGGSMLIAGLGWSWPQTLNLYPMNQVANLFGFGYTPTTISDQNYNIDGAPKLYNFYPDNIDTTLTSYCPSPYLGNHIVRGDTLRVLRMAISTMGEFTQQNGGTSATSALIDVWLETINEIFGREYCVQFEIVPNNNQLIFPNPDTDPWSTLPPGSGGCTNASIIFNDQPAVIDNIIGAENYDISHVIAGSPFGGGCGGGLNNALSGGLNIPVTRHEIGHQLAQSHTINYSDNRNYEPENGAWTIQGGNQQGYAHAVSFHQLASFLVNSIPNTGTKIPTGNAIPSVSTGSNFTIPISTPFTLNGTANDANLNDTLTYVWDNMNPGIPQSIPVEDDSQGALFMRLLPDTISSRTFPKMSDVVANNNSNAQEQLPTQPRIIDIRLTVNDNHTILYDSQIINASGINSDDVQITVAEAGPFEVTSQNTNGIIYSGGTSQMVTWNVNGTDTLPINTQNVTIKLSIDGGFTYPISLLQSTANSGSAIVTMPNISTTSARIQVAALNSIYFDINTQNFEIQVALDNSEQDLSNSSILIYPNPTKDSFKIDLSSQLNYKVEIYNAQSQIIASQLNGDFFDVSNLSNGVYSVVITDLHFNYEVTKTLIICR